MLRGQMASRVAKTMLAASQQARSPELLQATAVPYLNIGPETKRRDLRGASCGKVVGSLNIMAGHA